MKRARFLCAMVFWCVLHAVFAADQPLSFSDPALEQRYTTLLETLRCLVCQNQSLADSHADLAQDLRDEVHRLLTTGAEDKEILAFMVDRYGEFVLYRPPVKASTLLLWGGPALLVLTAIVVVVRIGRPRTADDANPAPLSEAERERLESLQRQRRTP